MNRVEIRFEDQRRRPWSENCGLFVEKVLHYRQINGWEVSILFCGNDMIKELNHQYRNKSLPTDVLTFSQLEGEGPASGELIPVGDIVISLQYIEEHVEEYGVSQDNELKRLLIHGILHLEGMDHETNDGSEAMLILQEEILADIEGESIL